MAFGDLATFSLITIGVFALLTVGLNMHWGDTGILNLAHPGFFALGAYTTAILTIPVSESALNYRVVGLDLPLVVGLVGGMVVAAIASIAIGLLCFGLSQDYLAMVTISFSELIRLGVVNELWLTNGALGIKVDSRPLEAIAPVEYELLVLAVVGSILIASTVILQRLSNSPFGRILRSIREDQQVSNALGKNPQTFKLKSFAIGAMLAGLAGGIWLYAIGVVIPESFTLDVLFLIWVALIIGGTGSYLGAILGTVIIVGLEQTIRFIPSVGPLADDITHLRIIVIGVVLILVLYYRPYGLLGDRERVVAAAEREVDG